MPLTFGEVIEFRRMMDEWLKEVSEQSETPATPAEKPSVVFIPPPQPVEPYLVPPNLQGIDSGGWTLTFLDSFDTLEFSRWSTVYRWNQYDGVDDPTIRGSSQFGNHELGWNINRNYLPTMHIKPWRIGPEGLVITADHTPENVRPMLGYDQADARNLGEYPYTTGCLHTGSSFLQQYGYFEAEMNWDKGKGLWPAFWLLPHKGKPPEIDILEVLGHEPDRIYHTIHSATGAPEHVESYIPDLGFHRFGVLWTKQYISWFVDGKLVGSFITPDDFHVPMYIILNLAVGGDWPGAPDFFTKFPAEMRVRRVSVWKVD